LRPYLLIAIAAECVYVVGRTFIRPAFTTAISAELAITAWRLAFALLYLWIFVRLSRDAGKRGGVPWDPLLVGAVIVDLVVGPFAWGANKSDLTTTLVFAATTPIVALREELFYRAILQGELERTLHPIIAILVTTVAFVLFHIGAQPMTFLTIASMAAGGVLFGVIYQRTRSLVLVVILHALYDWIVLVPRFMEIAPIAVLVGNVSVISAALAWWTMDRKKRGSTPA
jgi:membrane protease YdiL (CAAX protease family)